MTEKEMREAKVPSPKSAEELTKYVDELVEQKHDYGTCVYAMSMSAVAAFNYVAHKLGVTGFQASCADLDILRRTRRWERFQVFNLDDLLYPQYRDKVKSYDELISDNSEWLSKQAAEKLTGSPDAHPNVIEHWKRLSNLKNAPKELVETLDTSDNNERAAYSIICDTFHNSKVTLNTELRTRMGEYLQNTPPVS